MESDEEFNYTWNVSANLSSNSGHFLVKYNKNWQYNLKSKLDNSIGN